MGKTYSEHKPYNQHTLRELNTKSYSSKHDNLFKFYEKDLNLLKFIELKDFQQLLYNFASTKEERNEGKSNVSYEYNYEMPKIMFQVFFDRKILHHFLVFEKICDNPVLINKATSFYVKMFDNFYKNYKYYLKKLTRNTEKDKQANKDQVKKLILLSLAFNYCHCDCSYTKILFIFNMFATENKQIEYSDDLDLFLLFVLLTPSNIYLKTMADLGEEFEDLIIEEGVFIEIYEMFEVKDSKALVDLMLEKLFFSKKMLSEEEFVEAFILNDWILSPSGIRNMLNITNKPE